MIGDFFEAVLVTPPDNLLRVLTRSLLQLWRSHSSISKPHVTHDTVDGAAAAMHGRHHDLDRGIQGGVGLLGVQVIDAFERALDVREQDRDLLELAFGAGDREYAQRRIAQRGRRLVRMERARLCDRQPAAAAELRFAWILETAGRANRGERPSAGDAEAA